MTIEVFYPGEIDPDGDASREFAKEWLPAMDPILPMPPAPYHLPG